MKSVFEKIIERLEKESHWTESTFDEDGYCNDDIEEVIYLHKALEIVNQAAEEYGDGWIPVSERLPEIAEGKVYSEDVLLAMLWEDGDITYEQGSYNKFGDWVGVCNGYQTVAWRPLIPYQLKEE